MDRWELDREQVWLLSQIDAEKTRDRLEALGYVDEDGRIDFDRLDHDPELIERGLNAKEAFDAALRELTSYLQAQDDELALTLARRVSEARKVEKVAVEDIWLLDVIRAKLTARRAS
jgi:predicted component of type VI protein secretion system